MMHKIYDCRKFIILEGTDQYIVINKTKEFQNGHTHISNYNTAKWLIKMSERKIIPNTRISLYLVESLIRLNTDKCYLSQLNKLKQSLKGSKANGKKY